MSEAKVKSVVRAGDRDTRRLYHVTLELGELTPLPLSTLAFKRRTYLVVGTVAFGSEGEPVALCVLQD